MVAIYSTQIKTVTYVVALSTASAASKWNRMCGRAIIAIYYTHTWIHCVWTHATKRTTWNILRLWLYSSIKSIRGFLHTVLNDQPDLPRLVIRFGGSSYVTSHSRAPHTHTHTRTHSIDFITSICAACVFAVRFFRSYAMWVYLYGIVLVFLWTFRRILPLAYRSRFIFA